MSTRFVSNAVVAFAAGFVVVASQAFSPSTTGWIAIGILAVSTSLTVLRTGAKQPDRGTAVVRQLADAGKDVEAAGKRGSQQRDQGGGLELAGEEIEGCDDVVRAEQPDRCGLIPRAGLSRNVSAKRRVPSGRQMWVSAQ